MRVEYVHTGNAKEEHFGLRRVVLEPLPWPGSPARPIDDTNLGKYFFEIVDAASGRVLYSRGFASIYGEWETTEEATRIDRSFDESVRFPAPDAPFDLRMSKRGARNQFAPIWSVRIDPGAQEVDRSKPRSPGPLIELHRSGDPANKVDLLILGDGYTAAERGRFEEDARRFTKLLLETSPFKERQSDFNIWGLCPEAEESGVSRPSTGIWRNSPIGAQYDAFGSERYILTFDDRAFREAASFAPYDFVEILVNGETYGGGGIFGLYGTVAARSLWAPYVFIHEFGHHFAGLADEYYTSDVAYLPAEDRVEPWEPNVTALLDPAHLKWGDLVKPGTPIPTPWSKEAFEAHGRAIQERRRAIRAANRPEAVMDELFREQQLAETRMLSAERYAGTVGAFEGAMYEARGYYRPEVDCIMFTRNEVPFCAVCRRAISRVIDLYTATAQ
ncbi:MAG TPA: M64 family metallopeptidase [Vicinamibacterales bacterium]|nr:M64 family metallopeptidase [Vicinamibacterales bacterium]